MAQPDVKGKRITILGAARSGLAAARLLGNQGAQVFVSDSAPEDKKQNEVAALRRSGIDYEFGQHSERAFAADLMILSPGIPVQSYVVQRFIKSGTPVYSEIEMAAQFCRSPFIAVTGSNGKTTTTTLIGEMLKKQFPRAFMAGNIGTAFSEYALASTPDSYGVVEVSSFQLETIDRFHPHQAVALNFAPNHLDRYPSYDDYLKAKWRITKNLGKGDRLIYNASDELLSQWAARCPAQQIGFDIRGRKQFAAIYDGQAIFLEGEKIIEVSAMPLRGEHNYMNAMAAGLAALGAGVPQAAIHEVLATFKGVEHRLEFVAEIAGVKYINDSKATTVESLAVALKSFTEPIILIAGGKDKGSDFTTLNNLLRERAKEIILIGKATEKMSAAWQGVKPIYCAGSLQDAVNRAEHSAVAGDVVLLSPACASYDMFIDFEDRGRQFKNLVNQLQVN
jgi:UDP-N-acetylmuramoylalanine--D-glutamate ligase